MKVNLKKLGAIVAGAAVLASSAAFAGLMFGSTTLVDDNGAPVAKVVVGSKAHPSDGVAAALIANKMVSETFKSATLTAQVSGAASCTSGGNASATGTCSISNEKAKLEITVPGSIAAGTWTGNNLIGDFIDRTLQDRKPDTNTADTDSSYPPGGSDTSDNANPFTNGATGNIGPSETFMYRIWSSNFATFADLPLTDEDSGKNYVEMQNMWVEGDNHFDKDENQVVGRLKFFAYTLKFDGPGGAEIGIPECTKSVDLDYTACKYAAPPAGTSIDDATETHRLKLNFLGEDWIISQMDAPTGVLTDENTLVNGGEVKLAKESVSGILNQGESLPADNLKFQLDDLEAHGDTVSAIISILDANGNVLKRDKVLPTETKEYNIGGKDYRFHVYKVAPGYTFGAKWADVAIFSEELDLKDGQKLDQGHGNNDGYQVALGWKNLDAASGSAAQSNPDTLRTIVLYSDTIDQISTSGDEVLKGGDSIPIVQDPANWKLSYKGLDLTSADKSNLKFDLKSSDKDISATNGPMKYLTTTRMACRIFAPFVEVSSSATGSVFEVSRHDGPATGSLSDTRFYVTLNDGVTSGISALTGGDPGTMLRGAVCDNNLNGIIEGGGVDQITVPGGFWNLGPGTVFMKESSSGTSNYGYSLYPFEVPNIEGKEVKYQKIGDGSTGFAPPNGGAVLIEWGGEADFNPAGIASGDNHMNDLLGSAGADCTAQTGGGPPGCGDFPSTALSSTGPNALWPRVWFAVSEKAGTGTSNDFVDYYMFGVTKTFTGTPGDATFSFVSQTPAGYSLTSDNDKMLYGHATPNAAQAGLADTTGVYDGGTCVSGGGHTEFYCPDGKQSGPVNQKTELVDTGYISERGSKLSSISSTAVNFQMADKLAHAQWLLSPSSTNVSNAETTVATLGVGESTTVSGVTVKVLDITEDVGACSASGGAAACTADMSGVSAVIMPNNAASVDVAMPYTGSYGNIVILDSDAVGVNTLVSVGGDQVNSVTADLLQGSAVDWTATPKLVKEVVQGSKIVVAGKEKEDTLSAAQDFIAQLKKV